MDAWIRLDDLLPIAPSEYNMSDVYDPNPQLEIALNPSSQQPTEIDSGPTSDVVDLTIPQGTSVTTSTLPSLAEEAESGPPTPIPLLYTPIRGTALDVGKDVINNDRGYRSPLKHKLPPSENNNLHYPPKVCRIDNSSNGIAPDPKVTIHYERRHIQNLERQRSIPLLPQPAFMRNHTVTSSEGLQSGQNAINSTSSSNGVCSNNFCLLANQQNCHENLGLLPTTSAIKGLPQTLTSDPALIEVKNTKICPNQIETITIDCDIDNKKETPMFYQLLDMFPDIDLKFLENQCSLGLDINIVSEIILEMSDYPKEKSSIRPIVPTCNNLDVVNFKIPLPTLSHASNSTQCRLGENLVKSVVHENSNNFHTSKVPAATSVAFPITSNIRLDPTKSNSCSTLSTCVTVKSEVEGDEHKQEKPEITENKDLLDKSKTNGIQSQFEFLMEIFPDAQPEFMESKSTLNENELRNFIAENMEKPDYPKFQHSVKLENAVGDDSAEIGLYTTNFDLGNFLKIFPDPYGYFPDKKRHCKYTEHGLAFLKRRYRWLAVKLISFKYKECEFNLTNTCEFLDGEKPSRTSKRTLSEIKMPEETNLPFLQEACFIEHKIEIKTFLDSVAEAKRLSYEQAEARKELIECGCCYQHVLFEDCATCNEGHLFCKTCIQKSVEVRIGDGHTTFPCLQDCGSVFALQLLEVLVNATMFSRLLQRIQLDEVRAADIEGLEVCPFCDFAIILPPETSIFKCLNPECLRESCRKCHRLSHIPQRCEELESDDQARARKYIEDEMTRALIRVCYKCKKSFIKTDGCNKMTCSCGAKMCYICRAPIVDYSHFNGPGGDQKQKCPLHSTEKLLHVDAVKAVAMKALEEVKSKNPTLKLKHDPSKLLPSARTANTALPPGVYEEADRWINVLQNMQDYNDHFRMMRVNNFGPLGHGRQNNNNIQNNNNNIH